MSGPVDVLAVMDRLIGNARTMAGLSGDPALRQNIKDGEEARAAVAELIEAANDWCALMPGLAGGPEFDRFTAALANMGCAK